MILIGYLLISTGLGMIFGYMEAFLLIGLGLSIITWKIIGNNFWNFYLKKNR